MIEVLDCEFVRDQEAADLDRRAKGKAPLGPPIPLTTPPDAIVRFRGRPTPEVRRGRRPVDTHGLFRLLLRLARPFGGETA